MILNEVFHRFTEKAPLPLMVRVLLERTFYPERLDTWFEQTAEDQYTRKLLFSTLFELMSQVVCGVRRSVHDAYQAAEHIATSVGAVYRKLARIEPTTAADLVPYSAQEAGTVMEAWGYARPSPIPGYVVKLLDGNVLAAPEHRLKEWRAVSGGALPGKAVVVYEPARNVMVDVFPCEDGHAQERSLLPSIVKTVKRGEVWVGDRNFCVTDFLFGITAAGGYFIIREHSQLRFRPLAAVRRHGRIETGTVAEQRVVITDTAGHALMLRRVCVHLDQPTGDGDDTVYLLTHLPPAAASPAVVARGYRGRGTLETASKCWPPP